MAVKRKAKSSGGGANWMDTYGDMVTLLLCFFVLLYSMSTISTENWKALVMSFNPKAVQVETATSGNNGPIADDELYEEPGMTDVAIPKLSQEEIDQDITNLYEQIKAYIAQSGNESTISVTKGEGKVYITFNQAVFFDGESAELKPASWPILDSIAEMLDQAKDSIDEVRVTGHTARANPNVPNSVNVDRTLSSQRAANVIIYIQEHGTVDPARLISEGLGEWHPVATNTTSEGRARNRRVEMVISGRNLEEELSQGIQEYQIIS